MSVSVALCTVSKSMTVLHAVTGIAVCTADCVFFMPALQCVELLVIRTQAVQHSYYTT